MSELSVAQAALILGTSERYVRRLLEEGTLRGSRHGRLWGVDPDDVDRLARHRGTRPGATEPVPQKQELELELSAIQGELTASLAREAVLAAQVEALAAVVADLAGLLSPETPSPREVPEGPAGQPGTA